MKSKILLTNLEACKSNMAAKMLAIGRKQQLYTAVGVILYSFRARCSNRMVLLLTFDAIELVMNVSYYIIKS